MPRRRLLVVDDQAVNIQVLYQLFSKQHDVLMATSGRQCLEVCRRELPDLILLDVVMPEMDGMDVCRRLKADSVTRDIPVIFITGQDSPEQETAGLEAGAVDFITKPINPAVVQARVATHLTLKAQSDLLRSLAFVDGLTGIANRRRFDERLAYEWRVCRREHSPLSLILIDIDHFKGYNDCYGHSAGDAVLRTAANLMNAQLRRPPDLVARYGGEEFVCLMPGLGLDAAHIMAQRLRDVVAAAGIPHERSSVGAHLTISAGIASRTLIPVDAPDDGWSELILEADTQLYRAKAEGRNRVCHSGI